MKIIHWSESFYPKTGGIPSHILNLVNILNEFDHIIITDRFNKNIPSKELLSSNAIVHGFDRQNMIYKSKLIKLLNGIYHEIHLHNSKKALINNIDYDIFHLHGFILYNYLYIVHSKLKIPLYKSLARFDMFKNRILTVHNLLSSKTSLIANLISQFDHIICVDKHIYNYIINLSQLHKHNKKNIVFLPNSIDTELFIKTNIIKSKFSIGFVGRLVPTMNIQLINDLIQNIPENINFKLAVSGDLKPLSMPKGDNKKITILRDLTQDKMPDFYNQLDLVVNPILHGGISRVTLEAMACGVPVMMYNPSGRSEHFNKKNCIEIKPNIKEVIQTISFYKDNKELLNKISANTRKVIINNYSNEKILPILKSIYEEIVF